MIIRNEN